MFGEDFANVDDRGGVKGVKGVKGFKEHDYGRAVMDAADAERITVLGLDS